MQKVDLIRRKLARRGAKAQWKTQVLYREKNGKIRYFPYCLLGVKGLISNSHYQIIFMRLIDRLQEYLSYSNITAYSFEHSCELSNGYLGKQLKGKGNVGSEILERIKAIYPDLSLIWLVTGRGSMLLTPPKHKQENTAPDLDEEQKVYYSSKDDVIAILNNQIAKLEATVCDKEKIIFLLEDRTRQLGLAAYKRTR